MIDAELHGADGLNRSIQQFGERVRSGILSEMEILALDMENEAKRNRPWTDRTGNARRSIRGTAAQEGNNYRSVIAIGVEYGKYLELSNGGRFRIVRPTLDSHRPVFISALRKAFK